jgi:hypothetical protein
MRAAPAGGGNAARGRRHVRSGAGVAGSGPRGHGPSCSLAILLMGGHLLAEVLELDMKRKGVEEREGIGVAAGEPCWVAGQRAGAVGVRWRRLSRLYRCW